MNLATSAASVGAKNPPVGTTLNEIRTLTITPIRVPQSPEYGWMTAGSHYAGAADSVTVTPSLVKKLR